MERSGGWCSFQSVRESQRLANKVNLKARSRRNNLHFYEIPKESEGSNLMEFMTRLIKTELGISLTDLEIGIQRCPEVSPRSIAKITGTLLSKTQNKRTGAAHSIEKGHERHNEKNTRKTRKMVLEHFNVKPIEQM